MTEKFEFVEPGETVGIRSGTGVLNKIYKLVQVERLTRTRIVADRRQWYKHNGCEVGGISRLELMTPKEIEAWKINKAKEEAEAEERRRNYNPAEHDDHVQAALRALRNKTRTLCEKLQIEVEHGYEIRRDGPVWKQEFLEVVREIEDSEYALKSIGLSTTLKSSSSIFDNEKAE